jgi:hypothetical protein
MLNVFMLNVIMLNVVAPFIVQATDISTWYSMLTILPLEVFFVADFEQNWIPES